MLNKVNQRKVFCRTVCNLLPNAINNYYNYLITDNYFLIDNGTVRNPGVETVPRANAPEGKPTGWFKLCHLFVGCVSKLI